MEPFITDLTDILGRIECVTLELIMSLRRLLATTFLISMPTIGPAAMAVVLGSLG